MKDLKCLIVCNIYLQKGYDYMIFLCYLKLSIRTFSLYFDKEVMIEIASKVVFEMKQNLYDK